MQLYYPKFDIWKETVDAILVSKLGIASDNLPDCEYAIWHEDGISPGEAARRALRVAMGLEEE